MSSQFKITRLSIISIALAILCSLNLSSGNAATYYVSPKGIYVPGQSGTGYMDLGASVVVGKIHTFKLVAMGGTLTSKINHYRWQLLSIEGASSADLRIDANSGLVYGAGPSLTAGTHKVWASVKDAKGTTLKFWFPLDISQCNSAGSITDGTLNPCPELSMDNYNVNRVGYFKPGKKKVEFNLALFAVGGTGPYSFKLTATSKLPKGLVLDSKLGLIRGIPTVSGKFTFQWNTIESSGKMATSEATLVINP